MENEFNILVNQYKKETKNKLNLVKINTIFPKLEKIVEKLKIYFP